MKILYVIHDNKRGGAAISFLEMVKKIHLEHEIFVITPHSKGYLLDKLDELEIRHKNAHYFWWEISCPSNKWLRCVKLGIYRVLNIWNQFEALRISRLCKMEYFDIIHSNSSVINFGGLLSKNMGIPHIWHIREYGWEDFNLYPVYNIKKMYAFMDKYSDKVIVISKALKEKYIGIIDNSKLLQIYNGISNDMNYEKVEFPKKGSKIKFLIAGNYSREKGQIDVAKAVWKLIQDGEKNFEVLMAGNGDFKEVIEFVEKNNLFDFVKILGRVDDMLALRKQVDIEIVASKCEAFGRVTIEAMKCSNPIIATNAGGTLELVEDGITGKLFPYADSVALAECMKYFIVNPIEVEKMGRSAYLQTKGQYSPEQNIIGILQTYQKVLSNL